jgi:hypothetical protein
MSKSLGEQLAAGKSMGAKKKSFLPEDSDEYIAFLSERENQKERRVRKIQEYLNGKRSLSKEQRDD